MSPRGRLAVIGMAQLLEAAIACALWLTSPPLVPALVAVLAIAAGPFIGVLILLWR